MSERVMSVRGPSAWAVSKSVPSPAPSVVVAATTATSCAASGAGVSVPARRLPRLAGEGSG